MAVALGGPGFFPQAGLRLKTKPKEETTGTSSLTSLLESGILTPCRVKPESMHPALCTKLTSKKSNIADRTVKRGETGTGEIGVKISV